MAKRLGLRDLRAIEPNSIIWDGAVAGFGARRQKSDAVIFVVKYRTKDGRQRWQTIGRLGAPWTPESARAEARIILGRVEDGDDPANQKQDASKAVTVAELCRTYFAEAEAGRILVRGGKAKKPLTLESDRGRIEGHIVPFLGRMPVRAVTKDDVERMMHAIGDGQTAKKTKGKLRGVSKVKGGKGVATRTVGLLGAIFSYAIDKKLRADNPAHRVRKFAENKRERRLSDAEYAMLGAGLRAADGKVWAPAIAALRFLALTGWRSGEAIALRWQDVDLVRRVGVLPDTKTGRSVRPLSNAACDLLRSMPRIGDGALVFPPSKGCGLMTGFKKYAARIFKMGNLSSDITPHVLRHSFASLAADLEYGETTIGTLIGHKSGTITGRYTHSADAPMLAAADAVARRTLELMGDTVLGASAEVIPLKRA